MPVTVIKVLLLTTVLFNNVLAELFHVVLLLQPLKNVPEYDPHCTAPESTAFVVQTELSLLNPDANVTVSQSTRIHPCLWFAFGQVGVFPHFTLSTTQYCHF